MASTSGRRFAGIMPPLVTPLTADRQLDEAGLRRFIEYVLAGGVHGIVVLGSSGEAALLHPDVRRRVVDVAVETVNGRAAVVAGTGEPGTALCVESTRAAQRAGADAAIVVPPYYYPLDQEAVKRHYRAVCEVGLPLLAYHIPSMTKISIEAATMLALAEEEVLCGFKDSAGNFGYYQQIVDGTRKLADFAALQGSDALLYSGMAFGGDGAVSVASQVFPKVMVALYDAARAGDWARARALHRQFQRNSAVVGPGWIPAIKGALSALGICGPTVAAPNLPWDEEKLAAQRQRIEAAQRDGSFEPVSSAE
jgi:dihydrodipicolinate synthase/N-acetylneuraminate lyase